MEPDPKDSKDDTVKQDDILLQYAMEKLIQYGDLVGVSAKEMVEMLESGVSINNLLAFLERKTSGG